MKLTLEKRDRSTFSRAKSKTERTVSMISNMRTFGGRIIGSDNLSTILADNEVESSSVSEETLQEKLPDKLLINIYLWDHAATYFPFGKDIKSKNSTILKFLYLLSNIEKWEGLVDQRYYIAKTMKDMYGFSLMHDQNYLFELIEYMCECNCDPREYKDTSIFRLVELNHKHVTDTWNNCVLKTLKSSGKTLLSYHKDIGIFLKWLTLEISFEKGIFQHSACFNANSMIEDLMEAINNVLETYGSAAIVQKFLFLLSQQDRCFHLKISTKTKYKLIFQIVASAREFKTMWTSLDKNNFFK